MSNALVNIIIIVGNIFTIIIVVDALLSFVLQPYHPIRQALGRILNPIYTPIRRLIPPAGGIDFTPIVVIVLIQVIEQILVAILR